MNDKTLNHKVKAQLLDSFFQWRLNIVNFKCMLYLMRIVHPCTCLFFCLCCPIPTDFSSNEYLISAFMH